MTFWSVLFAVLWDRWSPLHRPSQFERLFLRYADWAHVRCNAGTEAHGWLAWALAALLPAILAAAGGALAGSVATLLGLAWAAAVLYFCLGFRQVAEALLALAEALRGGDPVRVRERLAALGCAAPAAEEAAAEAEGRAADETARRHSAEVARLAIEEGLRRSLDRLFGVVFWFIVLGAFGAVLYALTRLLGDRWRGDAPFHTAVAGIVELLDWLPARLLAFSFAVVGNFDDAMLGWRGRLDSRLPGNEAVVVAAGFGALGLNDITAGPEYLPGVVSLVARCVVLWLAVLGLLWLGGL